MQDMQKHLRPRENYLLMGKKAKISIMYSYKRQKVMTLETQDLQKNTEEPLGSGSLWGKQSYVRKKEGRGPRGNSFCYRI